MVLMWTCLNGESSEMETLLGWMLAAELRDAARLLGLATLAADKGELAAVHARLGELSAKIDALRMQGAA
jgi:hypothetical protein